MKPSHMKTPRTLDEGQFARGYTTEPVGRAPRPKWVGKLVDVAFAIALGLVLGAIFARGM